MVNNTSQLNPASSAGDFQPSTNNPQQIGAGSVQPNTATVQPVQANGGGTSAEQLYQQAERQPNLAVQTDHYSRNSQVSVPSGVSHSNSGLLSVTVALLILLVILVFVRKYWRALPSVSLEDEEPASVPAGTTVAETETTEVTTAKTTPPISKKKTTKKKSTAKKKKRSAKKR